MHATWFTRGERAIVSATPCCTPPPPPPPPRTKWTRRAPYPVLIGHAASLTPYTRACVDQKRGWEGGLGRRG